MLLPYPSTARQKSNESSRTGRESRASQCGASIVLAAAGVVLAIPALASAQVTSITNGAVSVGIDTSKGGAITLLKSNSDGRNLINTTDLGREIQPSYYSGPSGFNPNGTQSPGYPNWPWNPTQAGDVYGNASQVVTWSNNGSQLYVKTVPKQWALNNYAADAVVETWITLNGNVVDVKNRLTNLRTDSAQYLAMDQELPAVYTNSAFSNLYTYTGTQPFTGGALTQITNGGPPWQYWRGTESWAAHVDNNNFGLGVFANNTDYFVGGLHPGADATGYISPLQHEVLDPHIVYNNQYQLVVGSLTDIRNYAYQAHTDPSPNFTFAGDRQHWFSVNTTDSAQPGAWHVNLSGNTGFLISPATGYQAATATKIDIRAAYTLGASGQARLYWEENNGTGTTLANFVAGQSVTFPIIADGQYHDYIVDLSGVANYSGLISELRFDPMVTPGLTGSVDIASITTAAATPEPSSGAIALGLMALCRFRRRVITG
jgi:hypothetical protein